MASRKAKIQRKSALLHAARRPVIEEEDWEAKSQRLIQEHLEKEGGKRATSEERLKEEEDWERTQRAHEVHDADPGAAVRRWRELWEQRTPGGSNQELQYLCESFEYYSDILSDYSHPDELEEDSLEGRLIRLWKALCDAGLPGVCTMIARDEGLFNEKEVGGRCT